MLRLLWCVTGVCVCVSDLSGVSALSAVSTALLQSRGSAPHAAGETKLHNITLISNAHSHTHTRTHTRMFVFVKSGDIP